MEETAALLRFSGGDARKLINILDLVYNSDCLKVTDEAITGLLQQKSRLGGRGTITQVVEWKITL